MTQAQIRLEWMQIDTLQTALDKLDDAMPVGDNEHAAAHRRELRRILRDAKDRARL